jgi:hypothetical protein
MAAEREDSRILLRLSSIEASRVSSWCGWVSQHRNGKLFGLTAIEEAGPEAFRPYMGTFELA